MTDTPLLDARFARRLERLTLLTRQPLDAQSAGDRRSRRKGASLEFADYRPYVAGDDPGRVDWHVFARTDVLFVREYEDEHVLPVDVFVDLSGSMDWGEPNKLLRARQITAALGYAALCAANRLQVLPLDVAGAPFGPAWGRGRAATLLRFLDGLHAGDALASSETVTARSPGGGDLSKALARYPARPRGLAILISDLLSPTWEAGLRRLAEKHADAVVLHTLAPEELRPDLGGDVRLVDRETGTSVAVTLNGDAVRRYVQRLTAWRRAVESFCSRHGMRYVLVDTAEPVEKLLFETLPRGRVVQ